MALTGVVVATGAFVAAITATAALAWLVHRFNRALNDALAYVGRTK